jgi:hypothetical protein
MLVVLILQVDEVESSRLPVVRLDCGNDSAAVTNNSKHAYTGELFDLTL